MDGTDKIDKIVDKVRKLLALATSPNEHEAQLAAQRAHEILIKHNLDMQAVKETTPLDAYKNHVVGDSTFRKTQEKFVDSVIEKHFFVMVYTFRQRGPNYRMNRSRSTWYQTKTVLVGTPANVQIASYVRSFLVEKFYQLWIAYWQATGCEPRQQQSYYAGLRDGLCDKLESQKKKIQTDRGLILRPDPNFKEIAKRENLKSHNFSFGRYDEAMGAGFDDGKKIEIRRGLTGDTKVTTLAIGDGRKR